MKTDQIFWTTTLVSKELIWKRGKDWLIANPPRKSAQYEEWVKLKEKEKEDATR